MTILAPRVTEVFECVGTIFAAATMSRTTAAAGASAAAAFGLPFGGGGLGIGTIVVLGIIGYALGIDPSVLIGGAEMMNRGGYS